MNDAFKEVQRAYDALPLAGRLLAAPFAATVFALFRCVIAEIEALKKAK